MLEATLHWSDASYIGLIPMPHNHGYEALVDTDTSLLLAHYGMFTTEKGVNATCHAYIDLMIP